MSEKKSKLKNSHRFASIDSIRLDKYLVDLYPSFSRTFFKRLINSRAIRVDEHPASPHHQLKSGQVVSIQWPRKEPVGNKSKAVELPFSILHEEESFLVLDKPPHLLCHPTGWKREGNTLSEMLAPKVEPGQWPDDVRPGLIHRLDRDTSGVLVFAKTPETHAKISKQFSSRQVQKTYLALVKGAVSPLSGRFECYLDRDRFQRKKFAVSSTGRLATTEYRVLETFGDKASYLELHPLTGRTHQLRVQLSSFQHPIIGDALYGGQNKEIPFVKRQLLHAFRLEFFHPETGKKVEFVAPLPDDFKTTIQFFHSHG